MIYLNAENPSSLGDDTFWIWFAREFPDSRFGLPSPAELPNGRLADDDIVLQYSTLGACPLPGGKKIALLWELHPEMKTRLGGRQWDRTLDKIAECSRESDFRTVATAAMLPYYEAVNERGAGLSVLPIGVDTELFRPAVYAKEKAALREKHGIPAGAVTVGFWCGTSHPMKGFEGVLQIAERHPGVHWILVWKTAGERWRGPLPAKRTEFVQVDQYTLAQLMRASDFFASTGKLRPYFLVEWEAMAANRRFVFPAGGGREREFLPDFINPRETVFEMGWSREQAKKTWAAYLDKVRAS